MPNPRHDDPLPRALAEWRVNPHRNPQFRARVWERIASADARRPAAVPGSTSTWARFARAHAALVSALIAGAILAGAMSGSLEARHRTNADRSAIAAMYVHSLDARWMRHPAP